MGKDGLYSPDAGEGDEGVWDGFKKIMIKIVMKLPIVLTLALFSFSVYSYKGMSEKPSVTYECDSLSILDNIFESILIDPEIIGYSKYSVTGKYTVFFPTEYLLSGENLKINETVVKKYYNEGDLSTLKLNSGDIIFKKINFEKDFSELNIIVLFIGDDGNETKESHFTYYIDIENCKWKLLEADYLIIN